MIEDGPKYAIGLDYGTSSVRALVVDLADGAEIGSFVSPYKHGNDGVIEDPGDANVGRQHPQDYFDGLHESVEGALAEAARTPGFSPGKVVGIGVDTTGSSPMPIDANCMPLGCHPEFQKNINAMCWLWKDHTSYAEAAEIIEKSDAMGFSYMQMVGGKYSSEWFWAKILHCARVDPAVFEAAYSWAELADVVPAYLVGARDPKTMPRSVCAAGHKGLFNPDWGGLPSKDFLKALDPRLADLRDRLYAKTHPSDHVAGTLKPEIAAKLGLRPETIVAVGAFDAHMGAVGSGVKPGVLVKIMGTSTCDCMVAPMPADGKLPLIPGVCGVVNGSVLPGMLGIEAGQSAVGDLFNWFVRYLCPASYEKSDAHVALSAEAIKLKPGESGLLALDWNNGNRTILVDQRLTGLLIGQTLQTSAPEIYRALIEATAFGALTIIRRMEEYGACVDEVVNCGGIAEKSALTMQIYADVCNRPMKISRSAQTCALGAALFAGVAAGAHKSVSEAQAAMTGVKEQVYSPDPKAAAVYAKLYQLYMKLHDGFGGVSHNTDLSGVMKELLAIKDAAAS
jgi:L-ribulokinase